MNSSTVGLRGSCSSSSSVHDYSSDNEVLSDDADIIAEMMMQMKSTLEDLQGSSYHGLPTASRLGLDKDPLLAKISGCVPVVEFMRDDAFPLGLQAKASYQKQLIKERDPDGTIFGVDKTPEREVLTKTQREAVKSATEKSETLGHLFHSLLNLLHTKKIINAVRGKKIIKFAEDIIARLPNNATISEEGLSSEEVLKSLADSIRNHQQCADDEDPEVGRVEEDTIENLGCLLLLAQRDTVEAVRCASIVDLQESIDEMTLSATSILKIAAHRIRQHANLHKQVAIQNFEEASFHRISLEMADLLLLETGDINTGIINLVSSTLIPKQWHTLLAVDTLMMVLSDLSANPNVRQVIASVGAPNSPKNPSNEAIRVCLDLKHNQQITARDAQKFVLSALLGHYRQAKVGSCFATAWLIKALHHQLILFVDDLKQLTEEGCIERVMMGEVRIFPYHARVGKEFLDTIIGAKKDGRITHTMNYDLKPYQRSTWQQPSGGYLYEAPAFIAVCRTLGIEDVKSAVYWCLSRMPEEFAAEELVKKLANFAYCNQEARTRRLRSEVTYSETEMIRRAEFAFGVQTTHPLHLAYDQVGASLVNYFASQYTMPAWIYHTMVEVLEGTTKGLPPEFQRMYNQLVKEMFLPMIIRIRFLYNPHMDNSLRLFDDGNYGRHESNFYGYEAYDCGLPEDFQYSTRLWNSYRNETSSFHLERFQGYQPGHDWKPINTEESFSEFIRDVLNGTVEHLIASRPAADIDQWRDVATKMSRDIASSTFARKIIFNMLGKESDQKKKWMRNPYTTETTPWRFAWGGDFNEVMKGYFGFERSPSRMLPFNGSPKEVLAKCINFIKGQPDQIRVDLDDDRSLYLITSPVHAFLLKPNEETFQEAWKSDEMTNDYIARVVENPGKQISNLILNRRQQREVFTFIAENLWVTNSNESDDYDRQQLTVSSQHEFDRLLLETPFPEKINYIELHKRILEIVSKARAGDPRIGRRNSGWENAFDTCLKNYIKSIVPDARIRTRVSFEITQKIVDFARNRKDTIALSTKAQGRFREYLQDIEPSLNIRAFRQEVVNAAYNAYKSDQFRERGDWKSMVACEVDNLIFRLLSKASQNKLIDSSIVTHDPNWKEGIHDMRCMFMVNPGSGEIEFCRYIPDTNHVSFFGQSPWFPRSSGGHGYWEFPDNYRVYADEPLFNAKSHMNV